MTLGSATTLCLSTCGSSSAHLTSACSVGICLQINKCMRYSGAAVSANMDKVLHKAKEGKDKENPIAAWPEDGSCEEGGGMHRRGSLV